MRWPMLIASAALALAPTAALAHGGGVDANGCHTNKKTGDYHCHGGGSPAPSPSPSPSRSVCSAPAPTPPPRRSQPKPVAAAAAGPATLVSVGDGDTIRVTGANGQKVTIRMACSGACPLCGVAEGLRSAAATGKPLAASWAVVVGVGSCGGVVA